MSYNDYRRRKKRREDEEKARKRRKERKEEEHRQRDLRGENLYDFIKGIMPGLPHLTDARRMTAETLIALLLKHNRDLRADDNYLARWAAANDKLPLLQNLHAHGADMTVYKNYIPRHFAKNGNLHGLLWLRDTGMNIMPYLENMMVAAAIENKLLRMEKLLRVEPALSIQINTAINRAARDGRLTTLEWYRDHGAKFDYHNGEIIHHAMKGGHTPILDFIKKQGVAITADATAEATQEAAADGHLAIFKWLDDNAIAYNINKCAHLAANNGHAPLVRHLYEKGARLDDLFESRVIWFYDRDGHREISEFLIGERCKRNAHFVTEAFNQVLSEHHAVPAPPSLTRRFLKKFGL